MRRLLSWCGCLTLLVFCGCAMCANPHDCKYAAYGGRRERTDMVHGRVGSVFDPAPEVSGGVSSGQSPQLAVPEEPAAEGQVEARPPGPLPEATPGAGPLAPAASRCRKGQNPSSPMERSNCRDLTRRTSSPMICLPPVRSLPTCPVTEIAALNDNPR